MKRPGKKNLKHRRIRSERAKPTGMAAKPKGKKKYVKPSVQSADLPAPIRDDGFTLYPLGSMPALAGLNTLIQSLVGPILKKHAKTIKITKFDERYAIETRDYSCDCGKADCAQPKLFVTAATADGHPIRGTAIAKATTIEEVEAQHVTGIRAIRDGLAASHLEVHKDLSHALGNCECHGKETPKA